MVFLLLLGIMDLIIAAHLLIPIIPEDWIMYIGIYFLFRAGTSILKIITLGFGFKKMFGIVDLLIGLSFVFSITVPFLWFIVLISGLMAIAIAISKFGG